MHAWIINTKIGVWCPKALSCDTNESDELLNSFKAPYFDTPSTDITAWDTDLFIYFFLVTLMLVSSKKICL